jgi:DNA-binding MarR family transcriptional regulator
LALALAIETCILAHLRAYARIDLSDPLSTACVCGRLRRASRALTQLYDDAMAPSGLRVTQFSLVRSLLRQGPMRVTDLAGVALLDRTALSRALEPLVEQRLVRIVAGRDARTREVALTRAGKSAYERALPYWEEAQKIVRRKLGEPRIETLVGLLASVETLHPQAIP